VVYSQSWNFLLTTLPSGVRWRQLPVRFIAVSYPVAWFMEEVLELKVEGILPPTLHPAFLSVRDARPEDMVRVAWMPRKNKALAEQVRQVAEADLARQPGSPAVDWTAVSHLAPQHVAEVFASSHIYLATAFPGGFGLPPLEAMATGCVPVGFTGFGGWDYMRQACSTPYTPPLRLHAPPCEGNGLFFADGDIMAAGLGLARAIRMAAANTPEWQRLVQAGKAAARHYTREERMPLLAKLWKDLGGEGQSLLT
jgi:glycosyltransferase involved in cell wall biosynthesis